MYMYLAGCSAGQHAVQVWCLRSLTERTATLSQLSVCAPGRQVNKQASAKWVRVEMRARPWPHANTSPVLHHHQCMLLRLLAQQMHHILLLFIWHNIDALVQRFQFLHYCKQNYGWVLESLMKLAFIYLCAACRRDRTQIKHCLRL